MSSIGVSFINLRATKTAKHSRVAHTIESREKLWECAQKLLEYLYMRSFLSLRCCVFCFHINEKRGRTAWKLLCVEAQSLNENEKFMNELFLLFSLLLGATSYHVSCYDLVCVCSMCSHLQVQSTTMLCTRGERRQEDGKDNWWSWSDKKTRINNSNSREPERVAGSGILYVAWTFLIY